MDQRSIVEARRFANLPEEQREAIRRDKRSEFNRLMKLVKQAVEEWEAEFGEKAYIVNPETMKPRKMRGRMAHPLYSDKHIMFHRIPFVELRKLQRKPPKSFMRELQKIANGPSDVPEKLGEIFRADGEIEKTLPGQEAMDFEKKREEAQQQAQKLRGQE